MIFDLSVLTDIFFRPKDIQHEKIIDCCNDGSRLGGVYTRSEKETQEAASAVASDVKHLLLKMQLLLLMLLLLKPKVQLSKLFLMLKTLLQMLKQLQIKQFFDAKDAAGKAVEEAKRSGF